MPFTSYDQPNVYFKRENCAVYCLVAISTCTSTAFIHLLAQCALDAAHMNNQTNGF